MRFSGYVRIDALGGILQEADIVTTSVHLLSSYAYALLGALYTNA